VKTEEGSLSPQRRRRVPVQKGRQLSLSMARWLVGVLGRPPLAAWAF